MSPQLYAFILGSQGGVSSVAIRQWAQRQRLNPETVVRDARRAAARGQIQQRPGAPYGAPYPHVGGIVIYYVAPQASMARTA